METGYPQGHSGLELSARKPRIYSRGGTEPLKISHVYRSVVVGVVSKFQRSFWLGMWAGPLRGGERQSRRTSVWADP